jgi:hypothetical protein
MLFSYLLYYLELSQVESGRNAPENTEEKLNSYQFIDRGPGVMTKERSLPHTWQLHSQATKTLQGIDLGQDPPRH